MDNLSNNCLLSPLNYPANAECVPSMTNYSNHNFHERIQLTSVRQFRLLKLTSAVTDVVSKAPISLYISRNVSSLHIICLCMSYC